MLTTGSTEYSLRTARAAGIGEATIFRVFAGNGRIDRGHPRGGRGVCLSDAGGGGLYELISP